MKIEAKALLLDHAVEQLDGPVHTCDPSDDTSPLHRQCVACHDEASIPDEDVAHARAANLHGLPSTLLAGEAERTRADILAEAFTPGPLRPVPPPQPFTHADIARRSIAGDDEDATPRLPSLRGFVSAAAASGDWGVPVRSSSDPDRFGKGSMRGGGGGRHDPCTGREHYALAARELARIAAGLPPMYGLSGDEQLAVWATVAGAGRVNLRNIHVGQTPDAIDREERRAAKQSKRRKRGTMQPPAKRRATYVPERATMTSAEVADGLRGFDVFVTAHQVGLVCRRVTERVRAAFEHKGWIRERTKAEQEATKESEMAKTGELVGWKAIADVVGKGEEACRRYAKREQNPMPVGKRLGEVVADKADIERWLAQQTMPLAG